MKRVFKILILFFLAPLLSFSQANEDTIKVSSKLDSIFFPASYCWWNEQYVGLDSVVDGFHENADFIRAIAPFIANTGNVGSPVHFFKFLFDSVYMACPKLNGLENSYELMGLKGIYDQVRPYSYAMFVSGPKNEQDIYGEYGIQLKKMFRLGAKYVGTGGDGIYTNTLNKFLNLNVYAGFASKNRFYNSIVNAGIGKNDVSENAGVTEDTSGIYPVRLYYAKNYFRNQSISLCQQLNFKLDSIKVLNREMAIETKNIPTFEINHMVGYQTKSYKYTDDLSGGDASFYGNFFIDSSATKDTTHISDLTNELYGYYRKINANNKSNGWQLGIGGVHNLINIFQNDIDTGYNNVAGKFSVKTFSLKQFVLLNGAYTVSGYNAGDYEIQLHYKRLWGDTANKSKTTIYCNTDFQNITPSYFYENYYSNHFKWNYDFSDIGIYKLNAGIDISKYKIKADFTTSYLKNYIYYDVNAMPSQAASPLIILTGELSKDIAIYMFHLNSAVLLQKSTDETVVHLPLLYLKQSLYFESLAFHKALQFQMGVALNYFTSYYGNYYMPALGQFYLQNDLEVGNYPFIDAYAAAKVKRVRLFIKLQHLTSGLIDATEYMVPYYPVAPRMLKWGISWLFFD